jgi:hypothetical protein
MKLIKLILRFKITVILLLVACLIIDFSPLVGTKLPLEASQASLARTKVKMLVDGLASSSETLSLQIEPAEIISLAATFSHVFEHTNIGLGYSQFSLQTASTTQINLGLFKLFLNTYCEIALDVIDPNISSEIDYCKLGDLPVPGFIVSALMKSALYVAFDTEVSKTVNSLVSNISVQDQVLVINAQKSIDFKERVNSSLADVKNLAKMAIVSTMPKTERIQAYLDNLANLPKHDDIAIYIKHTMQLANIRSAGGDPVAENQAALWALSMSMSSKRFANISGVKDVPNIMHVTLRGRRDLALHFLISAMLTQFGNNDFSFNVGELKEILDSAKGGSGFSFADLLADKAGIAFASALTENRKSAVKSQRILMQMDSQDTLFPAIHNIPERLNASDMKAIFGENNSTEYQNYIKTLSDKIKQLPLYRDRPQQNSNLAHAQSTAPYKFAPSARWFAIDTHIHSSYSDGSFTINEVAENAYLHGCKAIAITDHGDKALASVLSNDYFAEIKSANQRFADMTVIPGFEWNIPPFNGREHATVLLPNTKNMINQYRYFRENFDHYDEISQKMFSIDAALDWLNKLAQSTPVSPIVVYNHPSRKDETPSENLHDLMHWQSKSNAVIGMSGAPGYQRNRAKGNGGYRFTLETVNSLDPITQLGAQWDQLLQRGYRTLGARAVSDFHDLSVSYWPCEFASTHVYANSNSHNDILDALKNGRTWAQVGKFVEALSFSVDVSGTRYYAGDHGVFSSANNAVQLNINLSLLSKDWQGYSSSLDALSLIVISESDVYEIDLFEYIKPGSKNINITRPLKLPRDIRALRLVGRSIQAEPHDYQVFTNPIFITAKN